MEEAKYIAITTDTWDGDSNNNNTNKKETNDHSLISVTGRGFFSNKNDFVILNLYFIQHLWIFTKKITEGLGYVGI